MSRIGNRILTIPEGVTVTQEENKIIVKGKLGELSLNIPSVIKVEINNNEITVKRENEQKHTKQLHGTINSLINNMLIGVSEGYKKDLEIIGVGYKFQIAGNKLTISAGYSHPVELIAPTGVKMESPSLTELTISGHDKQVVTEFAAIIRKVRKPEPYKGKGIRYKDEYVRRKEGKKAA